MTAADRAGEAVAAAIADVVLLKDREDFARSLARSDSRLLRALVDPVRYSGAGTDGARFAYVLARAVDRGEDTEPLPGDPPWNVVRAALDLIHHEGVRPRDRIQFLSLKAEYLRPGDPGFEEVKAVITAAGA